MSGGISKRTIVIIAAVALVVVGIGAYLAGLAASSDTSVQTSNSQLVGTGSSGSPSATDGLGRPIETSAPPVSVPRAATSSTIASSAVPATSLPLGCEPVGRHDEVALSDLPAEALDTLAIIAEGPPYPYRADGGVFQNREGILPDRERGYYHEFTVETPGSSDRGARRIVTGECGELWYTSDHYDSFELIDVER